MKLAICSDLHLEFGPISLENPGDVDVLILSGDIIVNADFDPWDQTQANGGISRHRSVMYHKFFQECSERFPHVVYVVGNHEHYHGDFKTTISDIKTKLSYLENVHVLDKEVFKLQDVLFIGATLWTDMNKEDPLTLQQIRDTMNDYRVVKNSNRMLSRKVPVYADAEYDGAIREQIGMKRRDEPSAFSPEDSVEDHRRFMEYLRNTISESAPWETVVVVGHHAPSKVSTHPRYVHETIMNGAYSSDLSEFMLDHPQIRLWTHGHTHEDFDYMIGQCRIVCNPRGYIGYEGRADAFELKLVDV